MTINYLCCIWPVYGETLARQRCQCNGPLWNRMFTDCGEFIYLIYVVYRTRIWIVHLKVILLAQAVGGAMNGFVRACAAPTDILDWPTQRRQPLPAALRCRPTLKDETLRTMRWKSVLNTGAIICLRKPILSVESVWFAASRTAYRGQSVPSATNAFIRSELFRTATMK